MRRPFTRLSVGLQTVTGLFQQRPHRAITHWVFLLDQLPGQGTRALDRPLQRCFGIATRRGFHQPFQRRPQARIPLRGPLTTCARTTDTIRRQRPALGLLQFTDACTNGRRRQVRCLSHGTHPSPTEFQGLTGCPQTPRPFIERAREPPKLPANPGNNLSILHARVMPDPPNWHKGKFDKLFFPNLLADLRASSWTFCS